MMITLPTVMWAIVLTRTLVTVVSGRSLGEEPH